MTPPGAGMTPPGAGMTGRLVLARHGETSSNVAHRLDSRPPGAPLTERGHAQAAALAEVFAGQPVVAVLSSVAVRAQQTAAPVAAALGLEVQVARSTVRGTPVRWRR
jgi:broad specificity phosphatase PhoE